MFLHESGSLVGVLLLFGRAGSALVFEMLFEITWQRSD